MIAILLVSSFSIYIAIEEHEYLYLDSVKIDLDALSGNLSDDLANLLAVQIEDDELTTILQRLDNYPNNRYAYIFDAQGKVISRYLGKKITQDAPVEQPYAFYGSQYPMGMSINGDNLVALKVIGGQRDLQGHLLIINDVSMPLNASKSKMLLNILPLFILVVVICFTGIYLLLNTLLAPLCKLSAFANRVTETRIYSLRPDIKGKYEVGRLSVNIEKMMNTIMAKNSDYTGQLIEQKRVMEKLANFDALTGLPNRLFFVEMLGIELLRAKSANSDVALLFFDLDGFKDVNDCYGHEVGDKLLIEIGQRVKGYLRQGDIISRLGGDEFLVLFHDNPDDFSLQNIAHRIITGLDGITEIQGWQLKIGVSIGIAKASQSNFNVSEFISNADLAMYRSKLNGKGQCTFFFESMMEENKRQLLIANAISVVNVENKFTLNYQPKVDKNGLVKGYEALLRWTDKNLGAVSPAEFIPIAESSGNIFPITLWVVEQVCIEFAMLTAKHTSHIKVSINLSALDIKKQGLLKAITDLFQKYDVDATCIEFEVTESAYLENLKEANKFFNSIRALGCAIALDDFGTGYSSLAYLTQISLTTLKIDKEFISKIGSSKQNNLIIIAIIDMANRLNLEICAEGVETRQQADFLLEHGCQQLQGYYFGRPEPLNKILGDVSENGTTMCQLISTSPEESDGKAS
jgi:diguanylate cyclase (GGDEF)-like protein